MSDSSYTARLPWLIVLVALASGAGLWLGARYAGSTPGTGTVRTEAALVYPEPRAVPPFELARTDGTTFGNADLDGAWTLVFFGFTNCPDICPVTLAVFKSLEQELAAKPGAPVVRMLFVSVDPARDDAKSLGEYVSYFSPRIVAATASDAVLEPFARSLGAVYMRSGDGADYTVDHSSSIAVIDPHARLHALFRPPLVARDMAKDLLTLSASVE